MWNVKQNIVSIGSVVGVVWLGQQIKCGSKRQESEQHVLKGG